MLTKYDDSRITVILLYPHQGHMKKDVAFMELCFPGNLYFLFPERRVCLCWSIYLVFKVNKSLSRHADTGYWLQSSSEISQYCSYWKSCNRATPWILFLFFFNIIFYFINLSSDLFPGLGPDSVFRILLFFSDLKPEHNVDRIFMYRKL